MKVYAKVYIIRIKATTMKALTEVFYKSSKFQEN